LDLMLETAEPKWVVKGLVRVVMR